MWSPLYQDQFLPQDSLNGALLFFSDVIFVVAFQL